MRIAIGSSSATVQAASCSDRLKAVQSMRALSYQDVGTAEAARLEHLATLRPAHEVGERLGVWRSVLDHRHAVIDRLVPGARARRPRDLRRDLLGDGQRLGDEARPRRRRWRRTVAVWPMFSPMTSSGCTCSHSPAFCQGLAARRGRRGHVSGLAMATCFTLPAASAAFSPLRSASMATGEPFGAATLSSPRAKTIGLAFGHAGLGELLDARVVGGEQRLERRAALDLMHEIAGGAVGDLHALAGLLLEALGDLVERVAQARRRGDGRRAGRFRNGRDARRLLLCACLRADGERRQSAHKRQAHRRAQRVLRVKLMTTSMPFAAA